jgi:hypothetical protein
VYFVGIDTPVISRYDQNGEIEQKLGWIPDDFRKAPSDFQNRKGDPMELIDQFDRYLHAYSYVH